MSKSNNLKHVIYAATKVQYDRAIRSVYQIKVNYQV